MTRTLIEIDPKKVTLGANVRTNAKVDDDFVASVKEYGILQPPTLIEKDGKHELIIGQRRHLAALKAGLKLMPAIVVGEHEADAARIVDQLTENEQREALTDAERAGGYQELALIGWSPEDIVKKTRAPRAKVDAAIKLTGHEGAGELLQQVDLVAAAKIAEFSDDKKLTEKLLNAARQSDWALDSEISSTKKKRAARGAAAKHLTKLQDAGVTIVKEADFPSYSHYGQAPKPGKKMTALQDDNGKDLTLAKHKNCPGHAAYVVKSEWAGEAHIEYVCTDWRANGHRAAGEVVLTPEEAAEKEAQAAAEEQRTINVAAARELRIAFIRDLIARNKATTLTGLDHLTAMALAGLVDLQPTIALELLDALDGAPEEAWKQTGYLRDLVRKGDEPAKTTIVLTLSRFEGQVRRAIDGPGVLYFRALERWGFTLSDIELTAIDHQQKQLAQDAALAAAEDNDEELENYDENLEQDLEA